MEREKEQVRRRRVCQAAHRPQLLLLHLINEQGLQAAELRFRTSYAQKKQPAEYERVYGEMYNSMTRVPEILSRQGNEWESCITLTLNLLMLP